MLLSQDDRFARQLEAAGLPALVRRAPTTAQVNVGKLCDLACRHCHVEAGPLRTELMDARTVSRLLDVLAASPSLRAVDITGGAPEMNPQFRRLVMGSRALGLDVMVRCNLTVLQQPGQEDSPAFFAEQRVHVIASLPCYTAENVDRQRGGGTFAGSIEGLRKLNAVGYGAAEGADDPDALRLDLVFNPGGPSLPPPQEALERDYRARLAADFGIVFDRLYCLANMPIHRFADDLRRSGKLDAYWQTLEQGFNAGAVDGLMCRDLVSIDWDGSLADCDFHQVLDLPLGGRARTVFDIDDLGTLGGEPIVTADHCLGCTAGQGSSCGGALT